MNKNTESRICQNCKVGFTIEPDDFSFYEKIRVPPPTFCPTCRQQRRMLFRNFKTLYKRPSDKSGKMIVSMYRPATLFPVWDIAEWWSDDWSADSFALDLELSVPFLQQLHKLSRKVPRFAMMNTKSENCEYSNMTFKSNNCYLVFGCVGNENCDYGHIVWYSTDCLDNLYINKCELCYECIDCIGSNRLLYSQECEACVDSVGLYDCRGCSACIGCVGLRQQSYQIFNQPVTKEAYLEFLRRYPLSRRENVEFVLSKREEIRRQKPARPVFGSHNNNVSGDHIYYAHNVHQSFDIKNGGENSRYCYTVSKPVESQDISFTQNVEYCYQALTSGYGSNLIATHLVLESSYVCYSDTCYNSKNLFGCVGLRNKEYCILNKQYPKVEYEKLVPQIIASMQRDDSWGDFFPVWMSPFCYNESIANEYMPLSKEQAIAQGFSWQENIPSTVGQENCAYDELPQDPKAYVDEELLPKILRCETCGKNYRFISREITFYKRMSLALPSRCFNCRHQGRMGARNPRVLNKTKCASCSKEVETTYSKEKQSQYRIYCEKCYQQEVY